MRILILGGTVFLGRALAHAALQRGHKLTLFNRGRSNPGLFPEAEHLTGNRAVDLSQLQSRRWDTAIDTCGYLPRHVRNSAQVLAGQIDLYVFISSVSVYADFSQPRIDENSQVGQLTDESIEEINESTYGPLKAACEQAAEAAMPGRVLSVRPGLIVGPHDPSDRFTYWPYRVAQGSEILAPGRPERLVQFIDVRDLAEWIIRMVEAKKTGLYNADGFFLPMQWVLRTCKENSLSQGRFTWVSEDFLAEQGVQPWIELPLWFPESDTETAGFFATDSTKAIEQGLAFRPLDETVRDTLEWAQTRPAEYAWRAGMRREREAALLEAWRGSVSSHQRPLNPSP